MDYYLVNRVTDAVLCGPFPTGGSATAYQQQEKISTDHRGNPLRKMARPDVYVYQVKNAKVLCDETGTARVGCQFPTQPYAADMRWESKHG